MRSTVVKQLVILGLALVTNPADAWPEENSSERKLIAFRFAPPDGTEFVQTLVTTREKVFAGLGGQVDEMNRRRQSPFGGQKKAMY